ncbi:MAG: prolyl-tRNA synthetase associated domain-containing protein [Clostridia bacterium]|nr:prolyl-tRNA synthetase associated domain-containing protein [Clostridia bacterium]
MDLLLQHGRPASTTGRSEKEIAVYDYLDSLSVSYDRIDHEAADTMEACAAVDKALAPATICKNLLLCNTQQTSFYLLMIREDKKFKTKEISGQIGSARLSFAPGQYMEDFLNTSPGSLSVMGLIFDTGKNVKLLIDEDVLKAEYFGCHPCINTSSIRLRVCDLLEKFLPAVKHGYLPVVLS